MTAIATVPKTMAKRSALAVMADRFDVAADTLLATLKATVIKPSKNHTPTNEEIAAFVIVANQYNLNPFTREIHAFIGQGGAVVPIVGVDGWAKVVNHHDLFDGCEFEEIADESGSLLGCTCTMYAKGRSHPVKLTEWLSECKRPSIPWQTMPRRMLRHKAFMQAGRLCFGLSGLYDEDEGRDIMKNSETESAAAATTNRVREKLKGNGHAPAKVQEQSQEPVNESAPEADAEDSEPSDQGQPDEDLARQDFKAMTIQAISEANTKDGAGGTDEIYREMCRKETWMGKEMFDELAVILRKRNADLAAPGKKQRAEMFK